MIRTLAKIVFASALLALPFSPISSAPRDAVDVSTLKAAKSKQATKWVRPPSVALPDSDGGVDRYIVQFDDEALPLALANGNGRLDTTSTEARAYVDQLQSQQSEMLAKISSEAGSVEVLRTHQYALNAATVRMTAATASKVRRMPGVRFVERDRAVELSTGTSVPFIGANQLWDGSASGGIGYLGEGTVVGIIDSGINHEHPAFAATGDDGYTHTNPLGRGNFLGECAEIEFTGLCNDKLIGAYTFLDSQTSDPADPILLPGDAPSSDTDGHGSHVASTAAGNILYDIALPDADGNPGSIVFDQISGVAPHANVVAYKVCAPSCFFADIVAAVDQAIADGVVDVLNHSIGSSPGNPWNSSQAQAFLNARAAGIFVANSAGNSGPDAGSAEAGGNAPWVAAVAATTHDRSYPPKFLQAMAGGDTAAPADITGRSISGGITGDIVYAGDFPTSNGSENDTDPAQCLAPFPTGTFTVNQIVMCDRGAIARVSKGQHVRDGGAGGFILGNVDGGATSVNNDSHVIPAIHINAADANTMRSWLASGAGHNGTITAVDSAITDPAAGDNVADFSSRGPYTGFDILAPNTAAPGVDILAAGADLTQGQVDQIRDIYPPDQWDSVAGSYGSIGGTSMSSPHIAGSAALLKQAHPDWTDAEVLSAIMTTGSYDLVKEDGVTPADVHDFGGGRVQLTLAVNAGLLLDESSANFEAANPDLGGDPATLNVAALVRESCVQSCTWTRTVTATVGGTWTASGFDPWVSVSPASFTLAAGQSQAIEITADAATLPGSAWSFSRAVLTPDDASVPTSQIPVAVVPVSGDLPASIDLAASRDAGSQLYKDVTALELTGFNVRILKPAEVKGKDYALPQDSDNSSAFDDLNDGVELVLHKVKKDTERVVFEVLASESPDLDLFVGIVVDNANPVDEAFLVCTSATGTALESCDFDAEFLDQIRGFLGTDKFELYALVQNWQASAPDAVDAFELAVTDVKDKDAKDLYAEGPTGTVPVLEPFDVRFFWDLTSEPGDRYLSATEWYADAARTQLLGKVPLQFNRGVNDVALSSDPADEVLEGDPVTITTTVQPNFTNEDRTYSVEVEFDEGVQVDPASITDDGELEPDDDGKGGTVYWTVTQESLLGKEGSYTVSTNADNAFCDTGFGGYVNLSNFGIGPDPSLTGDTFTGTLFSSQDPIDFYGNPRTSGLTVTDDGFGFFNSSPGGTPFINLPIPDPSDPNDMLAPLWSDWVIEPVVGGGITAATAGSAVSIVEWDSVEYWPGAGTYPVSGDFEIIMFGGAPDPVFPEIVFAYDNIDEGWNDFLQSIVGTFTTGVENGSGTVGTAYNGPIYSGLIVCFDYVPVDNAPRELSFTGTVKRKSVKAKMTNSVDNPGSEEEKEKLKLKVKSKKSKKS